MAAREIYKDKTGKRLPSVTTILSRFKESGGLLYWANQAGLDGKTLDEARAPAANAGNVAHDLLEAHVNGNDVPQFPLPGDVVEAGRRAFDAYLSWQKQTNLKIQHTEVSLVSEKWRYGGRLDAIGLVDNGLCLCDWKTGSLYPDHLLQVGAYKLLWEENYPEHPITGGVHLCRFAREHGDFGHNFYPSDSLADVEKTFLAMRDLYDMVKAIEKRVK